MKLYGFLVISGAILILANPAAAQIQPSKESLSDLYHGKAYSPYAQRPFPSRPLWGDTHLHTGLSVDAGLFGARLGLEEAYQFARGEEVVSSTGQPVKLSRPLDWLVITDHSDAMGFVQDLAAGDPGILAFEEGRRFTGQYSGGVARRLLTWFKEVSIYLGSCGEDGRGLQRTRAVHGTNRLRVDLAGRGQQPAPERDFP
jgi:hypothetical protein